jgi:hypothetical protein
MKFSLKNTMNKLLIAIVVYATISISIPAIAAKTVDANFTDLEHAVTQPSEDGEYIFSLYSSDPSIPFKKIHSWVVHIETKDGQAVEKAKVYVFGGMPVHQHDFPTKPRVKKYLGNGDYLVEGVKFNMPGAWEMRFNLKDGNKRSRAVFQFNLSH